MEDTNSNHAAPKPCEACSSIPPVLWANTGRGESLSPEIDHLIRLNIDTSNDLYECPDCETFFQWDDLPQYYGSGNNDDERLTRLTPEQESIARALLDPNPGERESEQLLEQAFGMLSHDIVYNILSYRARRTKEAFSGFVRPLVARLAVQNNGTLVDVLRTYCDNDRARLTEVLQLLDAVGPDISRSAQYFRTTCAEQLGQANRSGAK